MVVFLDGTMTCQQDTFDDYYPVSAFPPHYDLKQLYKHQSTWSGPIAGTRCVPNHKFAKVHFYLDRSAYVLMHTFMGRRSERMMVKGFDQGPNSFNQAVAVLKPATFVLPGQHLDYFNYLHLFP